MENLLTDILEASTSALRPSGVATEGVNNWPKLPISANLGTLDCVLETAAHAAPTTTKKRKHVDIQVTSSQVTDETCDAAAAAVIAFVNAETPKSPKIQRCMVPPDTPRTPSRATLPPVSPSTPDAAAASTSASLIANTANVPALQLTSSTAVAGETLHTADAMEQQPADAPQSPPQQLKPEWQLEQQELLFSPPASPIAAVAGTLTGAGGTAGAAYARSKSPAAAPVGQQTDGALPHQQQQQQPALQSLRLVTTQLSVHVPAAAAAADGSPIASPCRFTPATQATLQATTANVVAADALATAMAAARINQKSPGLQQQQQQQATVLPDWLCRSSADLTASAAVVQSSLLNTTAALARLQQHQQALLPPSAVALSPPAVATAGMGPASVVVPSPGVACFGLQNRNVLQQQQQQCGTVVVGVPVAGGRVMGVPVYPANAPLPVAAAECGGLFGRPVAAEGVLDHQLLDQDMDDAISCNSTPQSAAARSPRSPCWQSRLQEGSNSNGLNECDEDTDDTASSGYTDDSSSDGSGSSSGDESEDEGDDDAEDAAPCAADAVVVKAAAKTAVEVQGSTRYPVGLGGAAPDADAAVMIVLV